MKKLGWIVAGFCVLVASGMVAYSVYGPPAYDRDPTPAELRVRATLRSADVGDLIVWGEKLYVVYLPSRDNEVILAEVFSGGPSNSAFPVPVKTLASAGVSVAPHGSPEHSRLLAEHFSRRWRPVGKRVEAVEKK